MDFSTLTLSQMKEAVKELSDLIDRKQHEDVVHACKKGDQVLVSFKGEKIIGTVSYFTEKGISLVIPVKERTINIRFSNFIKKVEDGKAVAA